MRPSWCEHGSFRTFSCTESGVACGQPVFSNAVPWVMFGGHRQGDCKTRSWPRMLHQCTAFVSCTRRTKCQSKVKPSHVDLRDAADVLSTVDWAGVRRVWDEIQSIPSASGVAVVRKDLSANRPFYCLKALFNKCTSFEKLVCGSLAFEVGGSNLPGYGICFRIDSPWISSRTNSVQRPSLWCCSPAART